METHGFADLCAWEVDSVGPDGVTLALESCKANGFYTGCYGDWRRQ